MCAGAELPGPTASSFQTNDPRETEALGARLAEGLKEGDVVVVRGELGAGKTTLVRGAARALGVTDPVTSPTFSIGHRYRARDLIVSHLDLFRLGGLEDEEPDLLGDYLGPGRIAFVERPPEDAVQPGGAEEGGVGLAGGRPEGVRLVVSIRHAGGDRREIEVRQHR